MKKCHSKIARSSRDRNPTVAQRKKLLNTPDMKGSEDTASTQVHDHDENSQRKLDASPRYFLRAERWQKMEVRQHLANITLLGREFSGGSVIVCFQIHGQQGIKRMLAGDLLRCPAIVAALTDVDLATVGKLYAAEFGG